LYKCQSKIKKTEESLHLNLKVLAASLANSSVSNNNNLSIYQAEGVYTYCINGQYFPPNPSPHQLSVCGFVFNFENL
jgi:hypothetical protein